MIPKPNNSQRCFLGLGSNLNDPCKQINRAITHLDNSQQINLIESAPWYQSTAWGVTNQNDFINTVIEIRTTLSPMALLKKIKIIEYRLMQRQLNKKWHARKIDIDILLYGKRRLNRKQLTVPHPLIAERSFVFKPLLQLQPNLPAYLLQKLTNSQKNHKTDPSLHIIRALKRLHHEEL